MLLEKGESKVIDIRLFAYLEHVNFLYIACPKHEYLIKTCDLKGEKNIDDSEMPTIELYKLYPAKEVTAAMMHDLNCGDFANSFLTERASAIKPTYETEATALQAEGLLQGNTNGLDLLKPLTRAEAVTLLIRALGLENETANYTTSMFADISSENWASPYAALARERGITSGVSETEFAPNEKVTSDQFATFALRAIGESDFNYQQGTQLLIDKGIITKEQSETMDLFTRGDMAKIVYELREKNLM